MRTKNIYPTQLVIKRKEVKQSPSNDRLTLQYVEDMTKSIKTQIKLYDEQNNIAGVAEVFFEKFCYYYRYDGIPLGSCAMYKMNISLDFPEKIGHILHTSESINTLYYPSMVSPVKGKRSVVNGLSHPEIHEKPGVVVVNCYVVTVDKEEVAYTYSGIDLAPISYRRAIEILDSGCNASAGFAKLTIDHYGKRQYSVLKSSVTVNFVMAD